MKILEKKYRIQKRGKVTLRERMFSQKEISYLKRQVIKGFTVIEVLVVVGIIGMLAMAIYPSIRNSMETRRIENEARDILATMERARFQAVKTKLNHRVRFFTENNNWYYILERENTSGQWAQMPRFIRKMISNEFVVNLDFPDQMVVFSALGFIANYDSQKNKISLQSLKLRRYNQPDLRDIRVFAGGSISYNKLES